MLPEEVLGEDPSLPRLASGNWTCLVAVPLCLCLHIAFCFVYLCLLLCLRVTILCVFYKDTYKSLDLGPPR